MRAVPGYDRYSRIVDDLGDTAISRYDLEESGRYDGGAPECEQDRGAFTFSALCRSDQIAILYALDSNLSPVMRPGRAAPTSYAIKHAVERFTGFYVSNLQAKTAMRMLGYRKSGDRLNPVYNVSLRSWREFDRVSRDVADRRRAAARSVNRDREAKACARYFSRLSA